METPGRYDILDFFDSGFVKVLYWKTKAGIPIDISANTYTGSVKDRETKVKLFDLVVTGAINSVTIQATAAMKSAITKAGDYYWDLVETNATNPDGKPVVQGKYNIQFRATP